MTSFSEAAYMICQAEVELAEESGDGGGENQLRQGHAYTGACPTTERQRPPHLLDQLWIISRFCPSRAEPTCICKEKTLSIWV